MRPLPRPVRLAVIASVAAAAVACVLVSCATKPTSPFLPAANRPITVLLTELSKQTETELGTGVGLLLTNESGAGFRYQPGTGGGRVGVSAFGDQQVQVAGIPAASGRFVARSLDGSPVAVAGRKYRGEIEFQARDGALVVFNRLPLDDYLFGVLPGEVPPSWPTQSLRAQSIAARSYALHEATHRGAMANGLRFDVYDDVRSQVYKGYEGEDERSTAAVQATHGQALLFAGEIVHAYFHSTCGGHTADASQVLGDAFTTPLSGRPCGHCKSSKYYEWTAELDIAEVDAALASMVKAAGTSAAKLGELQSFSAGRADGAGRLLTFQADYERGQLELSAPTVRLAIGPSKLRSLACTVKSTGKTISVRGNGWGHGVGLCQIGAKELAEQKFSAQQIVGFYYPGSIVAVLPESAPAP